MEPTLASNPLLNWEEFPAFDQITPDHVEPALQAVLDECNKALDDMEASPGDSWESLMVPLERIDDRLSRVWGVVGHLLAVKNSPELRTAHEKMQPHVVAFSNRFGQSKPLFEAYLRLKDSPESQTYCNAQNRILDAAIRDARLSGVALEDEQRTRFQAIRKELAELGTKFSNQLLDATKAFTMLLTSRDEIAGLPESLLAFAADSARRHGHEKATAQDGPWLITLEVPSLLPFLRHSKRRDLREKLYFAYITRASDGEFDNTPLLRQILTLRKELAELLGFETYAQVSLERKMAPDVEAVNTLLEELRQPARPFAETDLEDLRQLAAECGAEEAQDIRHWDVAYWAERLREKRFDLHEEQLRPYFPLPRVLQGMFNLVQKLFDIHVVQADGEAPVWHEDVHFFHITDSNNEKVASFYLDPYSRPAEKRGGAWMNELVGRSKVLAHAGKDVRLPVAYMVCNQSPPVDDKPSLMTFNEVHTLFHEFGHALQHMLTTVDHGPAAGINNIEWDAVELASQFMENWCYHRQTLQKFARHYETGQPLPDDIADRLIKTRTFREGSQTLRQVSFGSMDIQLHHCYDPAGEESPIDVQKRIASELMVLPPLAEDRFLCSFSHIFAGGYAAGYFSYKWAEVLSADAFGAFEDVGLDNEQAVVELGRKFRDTVLALGGSVHPMTVFEMFRGRKPTTDALLRHCGLK